MVFVDLYLEAFSQMKKIDTGDSHPCSHQCAEDLVDVCVHEIEGAMFKSEIEDCANYME